ncbi:Clr5 domain-containing protein [Aspergillus crustosus]
MMEGSIPSSSTLSTPTPNSSSSPAAAPSALFRPRRGEDWNKFRPFIEQLYRDDQLKLRDVKRIMEREHRFVASIVILSLVLMFSLASLPLLCARRPQIVTCLLPYLKTQLLCFEKQYKDRLAAWNIRKNIKAKEVNIMIRKQQKRAARGKQTVFRVAGQKVDTKRIARFVRRYGPNSDSNEPRPIEPHRDSPEPATPSDMSYYTPEPDERALTLSPHPDNHSHHYSIPDSDLDDTKSFPITLSPTASTNDTPVPFDSKETQPENPWGDLRAFQDKLRELGQKLDNDTAGLYAVDDPKLPQY